MAQKIINVGTVVNDGTGDTIRGAFTNVNANFTEVYNNVSVLTAGLASIDTGQNNSIILAFNTANAAYNNANVGLAAANSWANTVATIANNYASVLAANNAVGANAWAVTVGTASNNWSLSTFSTLSNTSIIFNTANAAFLKSNTAFQNTSGTFAGNLSISGTTTSLGGFFDTLGSVRELTSFVINSNSVVQATQAVVIANNSNTIYVKVVDDNLLLAQANVGTSVDYYQYGTGNTKIIANDAAVTIYSSNNWANIAGQYLTAKLVKVKANTWMLTGNLKP